MPPQGTGLKIIFLIFFMIIAGLGIYALFIYEPEPDTSQLCEIWLDDRRYDSVSFCSEAEALAKAEEVGCTGFHIHDQQNVTLFMSCEEHSDLDPYVLELGTPEDVSGY